MISLVGAKTNMEVETSNNHIRPIRNTGIVASDLLSFQEILERQTFSKMP